LFVVRAPVYPTNLNRGYSIGRQVRNRTIVEAAACCAVRIVSRSRRGSRRENSTFSPMPQSAAWPVVLGRAAAPFPPVRCVGRLSHGARHVDDERRPAGSSSNVDKVADGNAGREPADAVRGSREERTGCHYGGRACQSGWNSRRSRGSRSVVGERFTARGGNFASARAAPERGISVERVR